MKKILLLAGAILCAFTTAFAQKSAANFSKKWVLGAGVSYTVNFQNSPPVTWLLDTMYSPYFVGGHCNICDSLGNLLLCSDGMNLYNASCDTIEGGYKLVDSALYDYCNGFSALAQASIILPFNNRKYYLITNSLSDSLDPSGTGQTAQDWGDRLYFNTVDMNANNGAGKVIRRKVQMVPPNTKLSRVQMTACRHANGKDWWLLKQGYDSNIVYKFLFKQDTVLGPFIQRFPAPMFTGLSYGGQSSFSADGSRYATTCRGAKKVFAADFDRCSGALTNPLVYDVPTASTHNPSDPAETEQWSESCQFSPSGRFLYVGQHWNVQQLDLQDNNAATRWAHVAGLDTTWDAFMSYSSIYPGPDGRLYVGNWNGLSGQMSYFATPDVKGAGCGFTPRGLRFPLYVDNLGPIYGVSDPPNMPNYALGATNPPCEFLGVGEEAVVGQPQLKVYPNPTSGVVTVEIERPEGVLEISDVLGRRIQEVLLNGTVTSFNLSGYPAGVYFYRWRVEGKILQSGKLVLNL